jgi:hypothetical protein
VIFYLGTHETSWLARTDVPLFISHRRLAIRRSLPVARGAWALDSGGFSELSMYGEWRTTPSRYATAVERYRDEIGNLAWVAPQDWMCEPIMLAKTGKSVAEHQKLTVENYVRLRATLGSIVVPVLQGWEPDDYLRHADLYARHEVDLERERVVGLGTICRRQSTRQAGLIIGAVHQLGLPLHGFGIRAPGIRAHEWALASADSMAWSFNARKNPPLAGCTHKSCANCIHWAMRWREAIIHPARPTLWTAT